MKKKRSTGLVLGIGLLVLILAGVVYAWNAPMFGKALPTLSSVFNPERLYPANEEIAGEEVTGEAVTSEEVATPIPEVQAAVVKVKPVCGGPEVMHVMVLGIDNNKQSDAIRLVRIDFVEQEVWVTSIPRDFYGPVVGFEAHDITQGRINATYGYGEWYDGAGQGIVALANNVNYNYGVTFDHYMVLHLFDIGKYIDMMGGVDVVLEKAAADPNHYYAAGEHHFTGEEAVAFMRIRYYDTDFARINRQSMILKAVFDKARAEKNIVKVLNMGSQVLKDIFIKTDFALKDVYPVVCLTMRIESSDVHYVRIPDEMFHGATTVSGGSVQIYHDTLPGFLQSVMDGRYEE